jgi:7-cyano-7-deazaguanine synthase
MNKNIKVVIALSGGMDSCVTAAIANQSGYELAAFHANYGQKTSDRELKAFNDIADFYGIEKRLIVDFNHLALIGGSSLTDEKIQVRQADLRDKENLSRSGGIPNSYVPFRNANILSACVSWAEVLGAEEIFIGAVYEDSSGYPDCRPEFYKAFEKVIDVGTKPSTKIKIITPVIYFPKEEIVRKGMELNAPFHLTWSCYKNEDLACGECDSCALRLRGFQKAGVEDPIKYKVKPNYVLQE